MQNYQNKKRKLKIAVVHDHLGWNGGGERTALIIAIGLGADFVTAYVGEQIFPDYQRELGSKLKILSRKIVDLEVVRFFWLRSLFWRYRNSLKKYDILIASGHAACEAVANYSGPKTLKILYNHTPPRRIYDLYEESKQNYKWFLRPAYAVFASYWHWVFLRALNRFDIDIANSENIRQRMIKYTGHDVDAVVWPPILTEEFKYLRQDDYFLSWARVDEQKRVELVVKAFRNMPEEKLIVVSTGNRMEIVKDLARGYSNIKVIGWVPDEKLFELVGCCRAGIYIPVDEDAGITQMEANAAGKPVLGVAEGGLRETVIDGRTGILIKADPEENNLIKAVKIMTPEWCLARKDICVEYAKKYDKKIFIRKIKNIIDSFVKK